MASKKTDTSLQINMEIRNKAESVALSATKCKQNEDQLTWKGRRHLQSREVLPIASVAQDKVSSHLCISSVFPHQSSTGRWTTDQVVIPSKTWNKPSTFSEARIISGFDSEPTYRISLPAIPHPVQQLLRQCEAVKRKPFSIISVVTHIRA